MSVQVVHQISQRPNALLLRPNVTRKSPTSYGLVMRKAGVSGVSPACYEEVGDVTNKSARKLTTS